MYVRTPCGLHWLAHTLGIHTPDLGFPTFRYCRESEDRPWVTWISLSFVVLILLWYLRVSQPSPPRDRKSRKSNRNKRIPHSVYQGQLSLSYLLGNLRIRRRVSQSSGKQAMIIRYVLRVFVRISKVSNRCSHVTLSFNWIELKRRSEK